MSQQPEQHAASLLRGAVRAVAALPAAQSDGDKAPGFIRHFGLYLRAMAIWVAFGDGGLAVAESETVQRIFTLASGDPDGWEFNSFPPSDQMTVVEAALVQAIEAVRDDVIARNIATSSDHNIICCAADAVFHMVIAADGEAEPELSRLTDVMAQFRKAATPDLEEAAAASPSSAPIASAPPPTDDSVDASLIELDRLVGLASVKREVSTLTSLAKIFAKRRAMNLPVPTMSLHLVFLGNPGTGKTTVARIIARIYGKLGLLSKGQLIEVDRGGLVANYIGQTATKTQAVIDEAMGGILFIDEAYMLDGGSGNDFGHEAVASLLKGMEDHRNDLVVIAAGYPGEMDRFLDMNPGLRSRMCKELTFEDYTPAEMVQIFAKMAVQAGYIRADDGIDVLLTAKMTELRDTRAGKFANGRDVRNFFESVISAQANRLCALSDPSAADLQLITLADVEAANWPTISGSS